MALHSRSGSFDHKDDSSPLVTWNMPPQEDLGYLDVEKRARDALPSTIWGNKFGKIPPPTNSWCLNLISRQEQEEEEEEDDDDARVEKTTTTTPLMEDSELTDDQRRQLRKQQRGIQKEMADRDDLPLQEARQRNNELFENVRYTCSLSPTSRDSLSNCSLDITERAVIRILSAGVVQ